MSDISAEDRRRIDGIRAAVKYSREMERLGRRKAPMCDELEFLLSVIDQLGGVD